jgi:hypothetical protein
MSLRQRKSSKALTVLKELDAYAKPLDDFQIKTVSGATVTLISTLLILFLVFSEFVDWAFVEMRPSLKVDDGRKEKMTLSLNVSFPHVPCFLLALDVMDVAGEHQNGMIL